MASIVSALAKATGKTAAAPVKEAKDYVSRQVDPSRAIYGLGLGVGPLLKSTVDEYKRQRNVDKERKEDAKEADVDRKSIKGATEKSAASLGSISKQLNGIATTMREVRELNRQQLKLMRGNTGGPTARPTITPSGLKAADDGGSGIKQGGMDLFGSMGGLLDLLGTAGKVGLAGIAGSLLYANRDQIKKTLDEFLQGAGLPSSDQIWEDAKKEFKKVVKDTAETVGKAVVDSIKETVTDLGPAVKNYFKKAFGLGGTDENGKPIPAGQPGGPGTPDKSLAAPAIASTVALMALPGPLKVPGAIAAGVLGDMYPEEALGVSALYAGGWAGKKGWDLWRAKQAARAAGPTVEAAAAANAAQGAAPRYAPGSFAPPGYSQTASGVFVPNSAGGGARTAAEAEKMAEAAAKQLTMFDKLKVVAGETTDDLARMVSNPAFKSVMSWAGKAAGTLGVGITLAQTYDDIQQGDYAAAGVRLGGLLTSLGLGIAGSIFGTPVTGVALATTTGVGAGLLADKLKSSSRAELADSMPVYNEAGDVVGWQGMNMTPDARITSVSPTTSATGTSTSGGRMPLPAGVTPSTAGGGRGSVIPTTPPGAMRAYYSSPVDGNITVVGGFAEPRGNHLHKGVDIPMPAGTPVKAIADGTVIEAGYRDDYGNFVIIRHDDGRQSLYGHLGSILVKKGDGVAAGEQIGTVGSTGVSQGNHLHLEILDADGKTRLNPHQYIPGLPSYSGKPMAGVPGATNYTGQNLPDSLSGSGVTATSLYGSGTSSYGSLFQNPLDPKVSTAHLRSMGFKESEIPELLEAQKNMRDLFNIGNDIQAIFMGGGSGSGDAGTASQSAATQGNNATPPAAAAGPSDFEKDKLARLAGMPAWQQASLARR